MNTNIEKIVNIIEENKTNIKDIDYKNLLEILGKVNKQHGNKDYYTLTFLEVKTSLSGFKYMLKLITS